MEQETQHRRQYFTVFLVELGRFPDATLRIEGWSLSVCSLVLLWHGEYGSPFSTVSTIGASCIKLQPDYFSFPFDLPFPSGVFRQHPIYLTRMPRDSPAGAEVPQLIPNVSPDDRSLTLHASCHQALLASEFAT